MRPRSPRPWPPSSAPPLSGLACRTWPWPAGATSRTISGAPWAERRRLHCPFRDRFQAGVDAGLGDQILMPALLDHPAVLEHQDAVGMADGGEAVGDDDGRPPAHQGFGRQLHLALGLDVERRRRLVE